MRSFLENGDGTLSGIEMIVDGVKNEELNQFTVKGKLAMDRYTKTNTLKFASDSQMQVYSIVKTT